MLLATGIRPHRRQHLSRYGFYMTLARLSLNSPQSICFKEGSDLLQRHIKLTVVIVYISEVVAGDELKPEIKGNKKELMATKKCLIRILG